MPELQERVILITGASAGIGEATARLLGRKGARLILVARRQERLEQLRQEIEQAASTPLVSSRRCRVLPLAADVTSEEDRKRIVKEAIHAFGRIDALVNNAGFGQRGPVEIIPLQAIRANFEVNLFGLIGLTQLVIPIMRQQGGGRIVNISSVAGRVSRPFSSVYDATKHALEAITDGLRGELASQGIEVVLIEPGLILTEFHRVAEESSQGFWNEMGPYSWMGRCFQQSHERGKQIAVHPDVIAHLILKAITARRPRLRYVAPLHAKLYLACRRWLPDRWFDSLMNRLVFGRRISKTESRQE